MTVGLATFIDKHRNVVLEIRDNDKILAWMSFTPAQAKIAASAIVDLADLLHRDEQGVEEHRARDPVAPLPRTPSGPRPGRGYYEEDAEGNEEGA